MVATETLTLAGNLLLATVCGAVIGLEREIHRKPAGLRTNMLIALGAALFTHASITLIGEKSDRIAAQIVTGIGFLGAGTIIRNGKDSVTGLTSAATVWVVASLGILAGAGNVPATVAGTVIAFLILQIMGRAESWFLSNYNKYRLCLEVHDTEGIQTRINNIFHRQGAVIHGFKVVPSQEGVSKIEIDYETLKGTHRRIYQQIAACEGVVQVQCKIL
jgi:putative Mg2+ transporter-C (MgtC) family protein